MVLARGANGVDHGQVELPLGRPIDDLLKAECWS